MILSKFKNLIRKKHVNEAQEARVEKAIADFKQHPQEWDEEKLGSQSEVRSQILHRLMDSIHNPEEKKISFFKRNRGLAAACFIIVFGASWLGLQYNDKVLKVIDPAIPVVVKTGNNEIRKLVLSDSSVVWLNKNSELHYPDRFGDKREVVLIEGEAYFDIHHDKQKPFQVRAGKTLTNVLGTAFNISAYSWLETIDVTVTRGKVAVNNNILMPNDQLTYKKNSGTSEMKKIVANDATLWMQGQLAFNDLSFKSVAAILENKYHVSIRFGDKQTENFRFTARFGPTDNLNDILEALTMTRGITYETNGDIITIN